MKKILNKRFILAFLLIGIGTLIIIFTFGIIKIPPIITIPSPPLNAELITYEDLLANNNIETYATTLYLLLHDMEYNLFIEINPLSNSDNGVNIRIDTGLYEYTIIAYNNLSKLYLVTTRNWDYPYIRSRDRIQKIFCIEGDGDDIFDYNIDVNTRCYVLGEEGNDNLIAGFATTEALNGDIESIIYFGGPGNDYFWDLTDNSVLIGGGGNDRILGGGYANISIGCEGNDFLGEQQLGYGILIGCEGNDILGEVPPREDTPLGPGNEEDINTPEIDDVLVGGRDDDTCIGGERKDLLLGQEHEDLLDGGTNVDLLIGGSGNDTCYGVEVDDIILFTESGETVDQPPLDIELLTYEDFTPGLKVTPSPLPPLDTELITSEYLNNNSYITTEATIVYLILYDWETGLDIQIKPRIGFDVGVKIGINQNYTIVAQNNLDKLYIFGSRFGDTIIADSGDRAQTTTCFLGAGNDVATCLNSINTNFYVLGEEGNDNLRSGIQSNEAISMGAGYDIYLGCEGDDNITALGDNCILIGGRGKDKIEGNGYRNILIGQEGDDTLLKKNTGGGILIGSKDNDLLQGSSGDDILFGGKGIDFLQGQGGRDVLLGGHEKDWLFGGAGEDLLIGGGGPDRIYGGPGNDTILFTEPDDTVSQ